MSFVIGFDSRWPRTLPRLHHNKEVAMSKAIGSWGFSAHEYSEDELVHIAFLMLQHALAMPELEKWRIPAGMVLSSVMAVEMHIKAQGAEV